MDDEYAEARRVYYDERTTTFTNVAYRRPPLSLRERLALCWWILRTGMGDG